MRTQTDKRTDNQSQSVANSISQQQDSGISNSRFVSNQPLAIAQRKLQEMVSNHYGNQSKKVLPANTTIQRVKDSNTTQPEQANTNSVSVISELLSLLETAKKLVGKSNSSWDYLVHSLNRFLPSVDSFILEGDDDHKNWSPIAHDGALHAAKDWLKKRENEFFHPSRFNEKKDCVLRIINALNKIKNEVGSAYRTGGARFDNSGRIPEQVYEPRALPPITAPRPFLDKSTSRTQRNSRGNSTEMREQRTSERDQLRNNVLKTFEENDRRFMHEVDRGKSNIAILLQYARSLKEYSESEIYIDGPAGFSYLKVRLNELKGWVNKERTRTIGQEYDQKMELINVVERINTGKQPNERGNILEEGASEAASNFLEKLLSLGR